MKSFAKGFLKGVAGIVIVLAFVLAFCYFTGFFDGIKRNQSSQTAATSEESAEAKEQTHTESEEQAESDSQSKAEMDTTEEKGESLAEDDQDQEAEPEMEPIHMLFAGDVYLPEGMQEKYLKEGISAVADPALVEKLTGADLFIINQEFPFGTTGEPMEDKQFTFRLHPQYVSVEQDLGVDLVTLANNHVLDFGRSPLSETLSTLNQAGIAYVGAGADLDEASACKTFTIGDKTIGFLGASRVIPVAEWNAGSGVSGVFTTYDPANLIEEIKKAKENCDFVVVYVHWGIERNTMPEEYQRNLGRMYIDAGADAVIGSHPHVVQGVEYYNHKPIVYSLGNFIFNVRTYDTMVAELVLQEEHCELRLIPCISEAGQVRLMEDTSSFYQMMENISFAVTVEADGLILH